jgi:hypothetical protein
MNIDLLNNSSLYLACRDKWSTCPPTATIKRAEGWAGQVHISPHGPQNPLRKVTVRETRITHCRLCYINLHRYIWALWYKSFRPIKNGFQTFRETTLNTLAQGQRSTHVFRGGQLHLDRATAYPSRPFTFFFSLSRKILSNSFQSFHHPTQYSLSHLSAL